MLGAAFDGCGHGQHLVFRHPGVWIWRQVGQGRFALCQRAGLVKGNDAQATDRLQISAAFDQNALLRRAADGADNADRRGDDQRAGARDHQHGQRPVKPAMRAVGQIPERLAGQERRRQGDEQCAQHHGGGVDARKAVNPALCGRFLRLRLFHQVNQTTDGVIGRQARDLHFKRTAAIERASKDLVMHRFVHRRAFAGDRGLIDRGAASGDNAIHGDAFARLDQDQVAHAQLSHGHARLVLRAEGANPAAVAILSQVLLAVQAARQAGGCGRRQRQQAADALARTIHRVGFKRFAQAEEEHDQRGFLHLPDDQRADGGQRHEEVHVQLAIDPQRAESPSRHEPAACGGCKHGYGIDQPAGRASQRQRTRRRQQQPRQQRGDISRVRREEAHEGWRCFLRSRDPYAFFLYRITQTMDAPRDDALVNRIGVILNPHLAGCEVDRGVQHPIQLAHPALQLQGAIGAVHAFDGQLAVTIALLHADASLARLLLHHGHCHQAGVIMQAKLSRLAAVVIEMGLEEAVTLA